MAGVVKEIVVVSGKGGTGKTSITGALAAIIPDKVLADCDVDAANLQLILGGQVRESGIFEAGWEITSDIHKCLQCEICSELCRFGAIENGVLTNPLLCEGCGVCVDHCPAEVLHLKKRQAGTWQVWETTSGPLVNADLGPAIESSGKLVCRVKEIAGKIANENKLSLILIDGPPGIGCPAIATITGASIVLAVVEPTVSALHDLQRLHELTTHFRLPLSVCINKCDLHEGVHQKIMDWCESHAVRIVGEIPYRDSFRTALKEMRTVWPTEDVRLREALTTLWRNLSGQLDQTTKK